MHGTNHYSIAVLHRHIIITELILTIYVHTFTTDYRMFRPRRPSSSSQLLLIESVTYAQHQFARNHTLSPTQPPQQQSHLQFGVLHEACSKLLHAPFPQTVEGEVQVQQSCVLLQHIAKHLSAWDIDVATGEVELCHISECYREEREENSVILLLWSLQQGQRTHK